MGLQTRLVEDLQNVVDFGRTERKTTGKVIGWRLALVQFEYVFAIVWQCSSGTNGPFALIVETLSIVPISCRRGSNPGLTACELNSEPLGHDSPCDQILATTLASVVLLFFLYVYCVMAWPGSRRVFTLGMPILPATRGIPIGYENCLRVSIISIHFSRTFDSHVFFERGIFEQPRTMSTKGSSDRFRGRQGIGPGYTKSHDGSTYVYVGLLAVNVTQDSYAPRVASLVAGYQRQSSCFLKEQTNR